MKRMLFLCAMALLLTACGNPKDANKKNFTKAIQELIDKDNGLCVQIPSTTVNLVDEDDSIDVFYLQDMDYSKAHKQIKLNHDKAETLVNIGFLNKETIKKNIKVGYSNKATEKDLWKYSITETGNKFLISKETNKGNKYGQFCTGKYLVDEIVYFTEPGDLMGMKISKVKFKIKLKGQADWIEDKELVEAYSLDFTKLESLETDIKLVLTNEGWKILDEI